MPTRSGRLTGRRDGVCRHPSARAPRFKIKRKRRAVTRKTRARRALSLAMLAPAGLLACGSWRLVEDRLPGTPLVRGRASGCQVFALTAHSCGGSCGLGAAYPGPHRIPFSSLFPANRWSPCFYRRHAGDGKVRASQGLKSCFSPQRPYSIHGQRRQAGAAPASAANPLNYLCKSRRNPVEVRAGRGHHLEKLHTPSILGDAR